MRKQIVIEAVMIGGLLIATAYTMLIAPGIPSERPWLVPLAAVTALAGGAGLAQRKRGNGRLAGLLYCLAALAPNGLYLINVILLAAGIAAIAGISVENGNASHPIENH